MSEHPAQTHKELEDFIFSLPNTWLDFPFGEEVSVYKIGEKGAADAKMFALIQNDSKPVRLSLKCDPSLAEVLREKYETVQPGYHLNKKQCNTIICSGQLSEEEVLDFIRHSYQLVDPGVIN